jgi:alpha-tubulin suppressor-like RCC1 family protein
VYTMGSNQDGKLGLGRTDIEESNVPCLVESLSGEHVVDVSAGSSHTAAVTSEGLGYSWGQSECGALGLGDMIDPVWLPTVIRAFSDNQIPLKTVSCGTLHTGFLSSIQIS